MAEQARILVVDDEPAVQNALSRALTLERYEVAQAQRRAARRSSGSAARAVRGGDPRHRDAPRRRPGGLPAAARGRRPHARADAHRARARSTTASPAWTPAPTTTSSSRSRCASCWRACARCCAAPARRTGEENALSFEDLRLDRPRPRGLARRAAAAAHAHRVPAAGDVPAPPAPGADPLGDLRARVGL